jgi:hypothetical protein
VDSCSPCQCPRSSYMERLHRLRNERTCKYHLTNVRPYGGCVPPCFAALGTQVDFARWEIGMCNRPGTVLDRAPVTAECWRWH